MLHNTKSTLFLRSRNLEPHSADRAIHHTNMDFDAFIKEDESIPREEERHHVDVDNLDFDQEADDNQDAVIEREERPTNTQDLDDIISNNVYIPTDIHPSSVTGHSGIGYGKMPKIADFEARTNKVQEEPTSELHHVGIFSTLALVTTLVGIAIVTFAIIRRRHRKRQLGKEVFKYISKFDCEEIDLARAATGGWHGTYRKNLRDGVETDGTDDDYDYDYDYENFSDDIDDSDSCGDDDIHDDIIYEDSARSCRTQEIVFMNEDEEEEMLVGHRNIYLRHDVGCDDDIYYASDDDLFSPVKSPSADII